ncbi:hypothetical protein VTK73DRAFT_1845 [Phialemonium thermophilum]|uniref:Uncharacterized protein n=1 Tax=Phialemonium thermophilum TaxID=223376 RepID=A0ABR3VSY2_9PEZI
MSDAKAKNAKNQAEAITQIANVSTLLRDAIEAAIPVAPEQYMSIAIPGTAIDVRDVKDGGTFVYGAEYSAFPPMAVRQAEARLVDNMIPLSNIMIGNTGKSVSRSYSRALDGLVPKKATVKSGGVNPIRSPGEAGYDAAMKYLTTVDPETGVTPVDTYVKKQSAWAEAQETWDKAKLQAQKDAQAKYPVDIVLQRQEYDEWNQQNYRKYKFAVQGKWMDWVANGHKYDVEFNFGMVDTESIMARVESSKESMRNSTMVDADGANELLGVVMTPKNWATLCKQKQEGWFKRNGEYSLEQLDAEIGRLQRLQTSYQVLQSVTTGADKSTYPIANADSAKPSVDLDAAQTKLRGAFKDLYDAEAKMNNETAVLRSKKTDDERKTFASSKEYTDAVSGLATARAELAATIKTDTETRAAWNKYNMARLQGDAKDSMSKWLDGTLETISEQITALQAKRADKLRTQPVKISAIETGVAQEGDSGTLVAAEGTELAKPLFRVTPATSAAGTDAPAAAGSESDPWVTISASFSAVDQQSTATTSSWGMSVGGGAGWGLWSVGGSYAHDESRSDSASDMASCDVSVTFDALVVNVNRPWLYAELFNDFELDVADNIFLSPGAEDLHRLMREQTLEAAADSTNVAQANSTVVNELAQYNSFPAFPTSFVVAANTLRK